MTYIAARLFATLLGIGIIGLNDLARRNAVRRQRNKKEGEEQEQEEEGGDTRVGTLLTHGITW